MTVNLASDGLSKADKHAIKVFLARYVAIGVLKF